MKYNDKVFYQVKGTPFDVQEMSDGSSIELFYLNEQPFFGENMKKGKFSDWSFLDGKKYRLFAEKGFYDSGSELFSKEVNEIWVDFWKKIGRKSKIYTFAFLVPIMLLYVTGLVLLSRFVIKETWFFVVGIIGMLIISTIARVILSKQLEKENILTANKIREHIGLEKFTTIVDNQNNYIEDYYAKLQEEYERIDREEQEALARQQQPLLEGNQEENEVENLEEVIETEFEEREDEK